MRDVYIDIFNNPEVLAIIVDSLPFLPGDWYTYTNKSKKFWTNYPNRTGRYFYFNFVKHAFLWAAKDNNTDFVPKDNTLYPVRNAVEASKLMDGLYTSLRPSNPPHPRPPSPDPDSTSS